MLLVGLGILAIFSGIGAIVDKILVSRHRSALHLSMVRWWTTIYDLSIPAFPALAAQRVLTFGKFIFPWKLISWQSVIATFIFSWCITSAAQLTGYALDGEPWSKLLSDLPLATVYIANYPYDLITVILTVRVLQLLRNSPRLTVSFPIILLNIIVTGILTVLCFISILFADTIAVKYNLPEAAKAKQEHEQRRQHDIERALGSNYVDVVEQRVALTDGGMWHALRAAPLVIWNQVRYGNSSSGTTIVTARPVTNERPGQTTEKILKVPVTGRWAAVFVALSTFVPTLGYMLVLIGLLIAKIILAGVRSIVLYTLEVLTEHDPLREPKDFMPFTLLGLTIGTITSTVRTILALLTH